MRTAWRGQGEQGSLCFRRAVASARAGEREHRYRFPKVPVFGIPGRGALFPARLNYKTVWYPRVHEDIRRLPSRHRDRDAARSPPERGGRPPPLQGEGGVRCPSRREEGVLRRREAVEPLRRLQVLLRGGGGKGERRHPAAVGDRYRRRGGPSRRPPPREGGEGRRDRFSPSYRPLPQHVPQGDVDADRHLRRLRRSDQRRRGPHEAADGDRPAQRHGRQLQPRRGGRRPPGIPGVQRALGVG